MSKKMTPCEKLGYKVGDRFEIIVSGYGWSPGDVVKLVRDDGTAAPEFEGVTAKNSRYDDNKMYLYIEGEKSCVKLIHAKLKPAKQALADAIHQNGGWQIDRHMFATSNALGDVFSYQNRPSRSGLLWVNGFLSKELFSTTKKLPNWHQCILSRDEYFTAYPDQVKVDVNNETEQKVEPEMKSESEVKIKVSDRHKNGELPPVGVFVDVVGKGLVYGIGESNCEVIAHVENTAVIRMSYGLGCFESGAITPSRTERDKEIDEMAKVIIAKSPVRISPEHAMHLAGEMHDYGYLKEVK